MENVLAQCVGVMYSGEYVRDITLSVYPHRASLKNMPGHSGNQTYDLWNTSTNTEKIIDIKRTRLSSEISHTQTDLTA
jgi:hypothetical protein